MWEILQTVLCGATLTVLLPPSEGVLFERALVEDFDSIATSLAKVDVRRSEAFKVEDQRMILGAVEQGVGFTKLNQVVGGQLREWLTAQAQAALARLPAEERGTSALINNLATLLQDQGQLDEARPLYEEALQACRETLGDRHPSTLTSIYNLGALLEEQGKIAEAIPLFTEVLEARVSLHGMAHEETLDSAKHLVKLLRNADQQDEADALAARYGV